MAENKNNFLLPNRLNSVVAKLSDKQAGVLFKGILEYADKGIVADFDDGMVAVVFEMAKQEIDYNAEQYAKTCIKNAQNGKLGGAPKGNHNAKKQPKQPSGCLINPNNPTVEKTTQNNPNQPKTTQINPNDMSCYDVDMRCNDVDNNLFSKEKVKEKLSRFIKPTVTEIKEYCTSRNNGIDPQAFFDFYESKGWKIGQTPMKNWQAAVNTWERRKKQEATNGTDYNKQPESDKYVGFGRKIGD